MLSFISGIKAELAFSHFRIITKKTTTQLKVTAYLIAAFILLFFNVVSVGTLMFAVLGTASDSFSLVFVTPFEIRIIVKVFAYAINIIATIAWIFPVIFFLLLSSTLKDDLDTFIRFLYKQTKNNCGKIGKDLLSFE